MLAVGLACLALGVLSIALPTRLYGALIRLIGFLFFGSAAIKPGQFLIGRRSAAERTRSWPVIVLQVAVDVSMGALLLNHWRASVNVATSGFSGCFSCAKRRVDGVHGAAVADGAKPGDARIGWAGRGRIGVVIVLRLVDDPIRWAGVFVGLKLLTFGGTLTWIALAGGRSDTSLVYELEMPEPEVGELYAVYFGTAFHLGVYIGQGEIVHYLNDNHVYRVTWEKFLCGAHSRALDLSRPRDCSRRRRGSNGAQRSRQDLPVQPAEV